MDDQQYEEREDQLGIELMAKEHMPYAVALLNRFNEVARAIQDDEDGGVMSLLTLLYYLPPKIADKFDDEIAEFEDIVDSDKYNRRGGYYHREAGERCKRDDPGASWYTCRFTGSEINRLRLRCGQVIRLVTKELDKSGLLWRSRTELVGGEK